MATNQKSRTCTGMRSLWGYQPEPAVTVTKAFRRAPSGTAPKSCPPRLWPSANAGSPGPCARVAEHLVEVGLGHVVTLASIRAAAPARRPMPR